MSGLILKSRIELSCRAPLPALQGRVPLARVSASGLNQARATLAELGRTGAALVARSAGKSASRQRDRKVLKSGSYPALPRDV